MYIPQKKRYRMAIRHPATPMNRLALLSWSLTNNATKNLGVAGFAIDGLDLKHLRCLLWINLSPWIALSQNWFNLGFSATTLAYISWESFGNHRLKYTLGGDMLGGFFQGKITFWAFSKSGGNEIHPSKNWNFSSLKTTIEVKGTISWYLILILILIIIILIINIIIQTPHKHPSNAPPLADLL